MRLCKEVTVCARAHFLAAGPPLALALLGLLSSLGRFLPSLAACFSIWAFSLACCFSSLEHFLAAPLLACAHLISGFTPVASGQTCMPDLLQGGYKGLAIILRALVTALGSLLSHLHLPPSLLLLFLGHGQCFLGCTFASLHIPLPMPYVNNSQFISYDRDS